MHFSDRIGHAILIKNNPTVMGLDPKLDYIPDFIKNKALKLGMNAFQTAAECIVTYNFALIDAVADIIPVIKPQLAYYEMYGTEGLRAFDLTCKYAQEKGLVVIADGKRNDIGSTAEAYSSAYLGKTNLFGSDVSVSNVDALTVNGYLGTDGIKPFLKDCDKYEKGIFVLVKTSNPSSGQLQDLKLEDGRTIYETVADLVNEWGGEYTAVNGYHFVGAVVGATYPVQLREMRERMPNSWILVPGYGAQGGKAEDVALAFDKNGLGAIVNASRSLMCAWQKETWKNTHSDEAFAEATREEAILMKNELNHSINK